MILNTTKEESLPNLQKAAMLLIVLGEQTSAELLQQLSEEDVQTVSREVAKITAISAEQAEAVLMALNWATEEREAPDDRQLPGNRHRPADRRGRP